MLDSRGVGYLSEMLEFPPYSIDLYLPEWHLAIEIDGPFHGPKRDGKRDAVLLEQCALPTLRLVVKAGWQDNAWPSTLKFIEQHADTRKERKATWHHWARS